jgi:hypothetical protein
MLLAGCSKRTVSDTEQHDGDTFDTTIYQYETLPGSRQWPSQAISLPNGQIWATTSYPNGKVLLRRNGTWTDQTAKLGLQDSRYLYCLTVGKGNDFWLLAYADKEKKQMAVHIDGIEERIISTFAIPDQMENRYNGAVRLYLDREGVPWLAASDPRVYRLESGGWKEMYRLTESEANPMKNGQTTVWPGLIMFFDQKNTAWIYGIPYQVKNLMPGLLCLQQNGGAAYHPEIEGLPEGPWLAAALLQVQGRDELWVTVWKEGTFRISLETLTTKPLDFPEDTKKYPIWEFFEEGGRVWAISQAGNYSQYRTHDDNGTLWSMLADGVWHKVIEGLDQDIAGNNDNDKRGRLSTDKGLWLAGKGKGLWWVPYGSGNPVNLNWRKGFNISFPYAILPEGDSLLTVQNEDFYRFDPMRALKQPPNKPGSRIAFVDYDLVRSQDGNLFTCDGFERVLREWSKDGWKDIPFADDLEIKATERDFSLGSDSLNRVWVIPRHVDEKSFTRVWNINTRTWEKPCLYFELLAEYAAQKPAWNFLFAIKDTGYMSYRHEAVFSRSGQAAFTVNSGLLRFYDGKEWKKMNPKDYVQEKRVWFAELQNDALSGEILFCIGINYGEKYAWFRVTGSGEIVRLEEARSPQRRKGMAEMKSKQKNIQRREEWDCAEVNGFVTEKGDEWVLVNRVLHHCRGDKYVPWFAPNQPNPFVADNCKDISGVMEDKFGRYLFFSNSYMIAVNKADKLQGTDLAKLKPVIKPLVKQLSQDSVRLAFKGLPRDGYLLRWRLAGSEWSKWETQPVTDFVALKPKNYVVQYEVMNKYLETSPVTECKFSINYDVDKLMKNAVRKLFSKNWDKRNLAVKSLAKFPEKSRELLKKVETDRTKLSEADQWWLDSALQQIGGH